MNVYLDKYNNIKRVSVADDILDNDNLFIDELIIPSIAILNQKGYETVFSCSGHVADDYIDGECVPNDNCYIAFKDNIIELLPSNYSIPDGFIIEYCDSIPKLYETCIRKIYDSNQDRFFQMLDTVKELYAWALSLPKINS